MEVGRILAPHGVQGQFRVRPHAGSADVLLACGHWFLRLAPPPPGDSVPETGESVVALHTVSVSGQGDTLHAATPVVTSRADAERLQGATVFIARSDFPALSPGQYYWLDLIGLRVVNRDGVAFGTVRDLMETGPNQVLVVSGTPPEHAASPTLIPFVEAWVDSVDLDAGLITVGWQPDY